MRNFRRLTVWQKSYQLTITIYKTTAQFPREELFGLVGQIRRAALSIPANIAEGCGYESDSQLKRFLMIASGSAFELDCHIMLSKDLGFISEEVYSDLAHSIIEIQKMLFRFTSQIPKPP